MLDGRIKNLLIDFGGVLIDLDRRRCLEHFRLLGMPDVENLLHDCHQEGFFQLHEKGLISDADFRERIRQAIGRPVADEAIDEAWNSFLDGIPAYKLDFLLELCTRYDVCLLSNTNAIHWNYACTHDFAQGGHRVEDYFDRIYLSYQMKMIKPAGCPKRRCSSTMPKPTAARRNRSASGPIPRKPMRIGDICSNNLPSVATIGFFDGVHRGHRFLIGQVRREAAARGLDAAVITFPVHPRQVLQCDYRPQLLTTPQEKLSLLAETGIDTCILLDFTPHLASLTAREFMEVLKNRYRIRALVIGYDHRFGHNRSEGFGDYARYGQELGIDVLPADAFHLPTAPDGSPVSSSLVRRLLRTGDAAQAAECLGYPYFLNGTVVSGRRIGHQLGYPTANLQPDHPDKIIPANGVYAVRVETGGKTYGGMLNIGRRPTLDNGDDRSIEVHIFDFDRDIYRESLRLSFVQRIREERKFNSVDELTEQLHRDAETIRALLQAPHTVP